MIRLLEFDRRLTNRNAWIVMVISTVAILAGFHHHNSPFSLMFVTSLFALVQRCSLPDSLGRLVALVSPSLYAVFIIHGTRCGRWFYEWFQSCLIDVMHVPVFAAYLIDAIAVFLGCLLIDAVRRSCISLMQRNQA